MPKIEMSTGKVVEVLPSRDVDTEYRALKLSGASASGSEDSDDARVSLAESMLTDIAYKAVMVQSVNGKGFDELTTGLTSEEILLSFRKNFTDGEWAELKAALKQIAPEASEKAPVGKFKIHYT